MPNTNDPVKQLIQNMETVSSQEILDAYGITEYTADELISDFETAVAYKQEQERVFKILDAADHSDVWKTFTRKIPNFVQTPVHNPITIIKEATKASVMPTAYAGDFRPLTLNAKELANAANKFFQMKWNSAGMDEVNSDAADYAFLHGTSGVLFGWDENIIDASDLTNSFGALQSSPMQAKAWHPSNIFPDPTANDVNEMRYLFFAERKSKAFLKSIPRFAPVLATIEASNDSIGNTNPNHILDKAKQSDREIVTFLTCYRTVQRLRQDPVSGQTSIVPAVDIIYMAGRNILDVSRDIQPACIPFVPLYDERIPNNFWGISRCYKVLSLVLTLNQLDSIEATAYLKNQNPVEFVNAMAGLNLAEYQAKRDNPDAAFNVNCDPKAVQSYAERPALPTTLDGFRQYLISMISEISGVDSAYLGRSYGSIQTTGGVQQAIDRATMRDSSRIKAIDRFIRQEITMLVRFHIAHGQREQFFPGGVDARRTQDGQELTFDPASLVGRSDIELNVSAVAPRTNASYEEAAQKLMELQLKYNPAEKGYPDLLTPEELIDWMNIPTSQKNVLIERMRNQMGLMKTEEYTAVLTAVGTLTQGGMTPEQAIQQVVQQMAQSGMGQLPATNPNPGQPMPR